MILNARLEDKMNIFQEKSLSLSSIEPFTNSANNQAKESISKHNCREKFFPSDIIPDTKNKIL